MFRFLWICLGGAVGTVARYVVSGRAARWPGPGFPFGTLAERSSHAPSPVAATLEGGVSRQFLLAAAWLAAPLLGCAADGGSARSALPGPVVEEFVIPSPGASPWGITAGRDGAIWFTESRGNRIGRLHPNDPSAIEEIPLRAAQSDPRSMTTASDGALWFFLNGTKRVGRMEPAAPHAVEESPLPSSNSYVYGMAADSAGGVWLAEGTRLLRFAARPPHTTSEIRIRGYSVGITVASDGDLWVAAQGWNSLGRVRPKSPEEIELFEIAVPDCHTMAVAPGGRRAIWFLDAVCRTFGRFGLQPPHPVKEFELSARLGTMVDLAVTADGRVWLLGKDALYRAQTEPPYALTRFPIPTSGADPQKLIVGSDGNLWFTESGAGRIGRLVLARTRGRSNVAPSADLVAQARPEYTARPRPPPLSSINLWTDLPCVVTIDGVEKGKLRRKDGDVFLVPPGPHIVTAVESESGRTWTRVVDTSLEHGAVVEIDFTSAIAEEALHFEPALPAIAFVRVPSGEFWMGDDRLDFGQAGPRHRVRINRPFEIGKRLVTQEQWKRVMSRNPTPWEYEGDDRPVVNVSWDEAQEFLRRLRQLDSSRDYRLPTEAEWEYACRAGNERDALERDEKVSLGPALRTTPERRENAWGISDLGGTTSEWCQDWYGQEYYRVSPVDDPTGPRSGSNRVAKGGNFGSDVSGLRPAKRQSYLPTYRAFNLGFRVVRVPR